MTPPTSGARIVAYVTHGFVMTISANGVAVH